MHHDQRKRQLGFTLFEIMITVAIIALISGGIALALLDHSNRAKVRLAGTHAEQVRGGAKMAMAEGAEGTTPGCPTFESLVEHDILDEASPRKDPWGNPWRIECDGLKVTVSTNGPDRQPGTADDIRIPRP
jgi:prepilin-type N-terminal cleavage/methylation domain-containing protein